MFPATVCLTNITVCDHYYTTSLINLGGVQALVKIINLNSLSTSALAVKALANIACDSDEYFSLTKSSEVFEKIGCLLDENKEVNTDLYLSLGFYILCITYRYKFLDSD